MEPSKGDILKREVVDVSRRCGAQGWCPGTLGNISALNPRSGRVYIKRSGADMSRLELADVLTLDLKGNLLEGEGKPSIEASFHLGIYRVREDAQAVFHVHPPFATAYAVAGKKVPMVTEAAKILLVDVPLLPHAPSGSLELASNVINSFKNSEVKAVLLREHGIVSTGDSLERAYQVAALVEDTAKIALLSSLVKG